MQLSQVYTASVLEKAMWKLKKKNIYTFYYYYFFMFMFENVYN